MYSIINGNACTWLADYTDAPAGHHTSCIPSIPFQKLSKLIAEKRFRIVLFVLQILIWLKYIGYVTDYRNNGFHKLYLVSQIKR
jgi:hypothetical protein